MVLPVFLEGGEVVLDGVEVRRIRWQEQQHGAGVFDELRRFRRLVKGGVVHDDEMAAVQAWAEPRLEPAVEHRRIARSFQEERFSKSPFNAGRDQRGTRPLCPAISP